jgi:hypothetical protein
MSKTMKSPLSFWISPAALAVAAALASGCAEEVRRFGGSDATATPTDNPEGNASSCDGGQSICRGNCVDLSSDFANCGRCGNSCQAGYVCISGQCTVDCPKGQVRCGTTCVNLMVAQNNCGTCGTACPTGSVCNGRPLRRRVHRRPTSRATS